MILKKYHLQLNLPNSHIWEGFINVKAKKIEDFPKIPEGEFFIMKDDEGWHGEFTLTNAGNCVVDYNHVISYWYSYRDNAPCPKFYSTADATAWIDKYDNKIGKDENIQIPLTKARLEDSLQYNKFSKEPIVEIYE